MLHKHYKKYVYRKNLERIYNKEKKQLSRESDPGKPGQSTSARKVGSKTTVPRCKG